MTAPLRTAVLAVAVLVASPLAARSGPKAATTFEELWRDVDPRRDPLDVKVVRHWEDNGVVLRYVLYTVGTFRGRASRVAAYYGFPAKGHNLPGLVQLHGGGQRASLAEVKYYASRGYACLSINWGGRPMEDARPGEPNTDWGKVDPTQQNVRGYFNFAPGPKYVDPEPSGRNNNWYLLTLAGRRGLTFLEQQKEVDAGRLGVYGHSMGGNLTVYVAGTDSRVKVAAPSAGGTGFRSFPWPLLPAYRPRNYAPHTGLYRRMMAFQSYAPHVRAPLLYLSATDDFHARMDNMYRTGALMTHAPVRYSVTPHMNHRFTPAFAVTRPLWIDHYLKGGAPLAATPKTELRLKTEDGTPRLVVRPDRPKAAAAVRVYYSVDPDPRARFWRSAEAEADRQAGQWTAALPLTSLDRPLFAHADVDYALPKPVRLIHEQADRYALTSLLHTATPTELKQAGMRAKPVARPAAGVLVIDDFSHDWRDWYSLNGDNPHHWQFWTRKVTDPLWRGPKGAELTVTVVSPKANDLVVVLNENTWRNYRGKARTYVAVAKLKAAKGPQTVLLALADFHAARDGKSPTSWAQMDELGLSSWYTPRVRGSKAKPKRLGTQWQGPVPTFRHVAWRLGGTGQSNQRPECPPVRAASGDSKLARGMLHCGRVNERVSGKEHSCLLPCTDVDFWNPSRSAPRRPLWRRACSPPTRSPHASPSARLGASPTSSSSTPTTRATAI